MTRIQVAVGPEPLHPERQMRWLYSLKGGAVCSFTGQVRSEAGRVSELDIEHYDHMTQKSMQSLAEMASDRWPLLGISMAHRIGRMHPEDLIVFVGVAADHRSHAHSACEYLVDCLKTEAALWKREKRNGAWLWLEQKASDRARWQRWGDAGGDGR